MDYIKVIDAMSDAFSSFPAGDDLMRSISVRERKEIEKEKTIPTTVFGGGLFVHVKNGRVTKVDPLTLPENTSQYKIEARGKVFEPPKRCLPDMQAHGYRRWVYDASRVRYPMKRVGWEPGGKGNYDNRGLAEYVRISWDEALDLIASEVKRVKETYGNSAFTYMDTFHTTWGTIHGMGTEYTIIPKFLNILGGFTEYTIGTSSWVGWVSGASFMYGFWWANSTSEGTDTLTDCLQNSRMVVYWSHDPTKSNRMYHGHETEVWKRFVNEAGIKTVSVSPELHDTAVAHADRWIPVYPGSDAAMAAAMMYVWLTEGTYDKEYVKTHTVGFEKLRDYILGKEDGIPKTPEWAANICGASADNITGFAREWAAGPVTLHCQLGAACRGWFGHEWTRMMVALQTLQGLGKPGVNLCNWGFSSGGAPFDKSIRMSGYTTGVKPVEAKSYPNPIPQKIHAIDVSDCILNPPVKWRGGSTGATYWGEEFFRNYEYPMQGYSEVKMLFRLGGGQFGSYSNIPWRAKTYLTPKIETIVITALFMEPCMRYADFLLPACTDFERQDISMLGCGGLYIPYMGSANHQIAFYHKRCIEPLGQSMSDMDIYYNLAKKLGIYEQLSEGNTEEDWIKKLYDASSLPKFISFEEFKKKGWYIFPFPENYEPTPALRWFYKDATGLATPSGKLELYSQVLADFYGEKNPEIAPYPRYIEPKDGRNSAEAKKYPLVAFVPHPKFRFHTMQENVTWLRDLHKIKGEDGWEREPIWISTVDAAARGIKDKDTVMVFNDRGKVLAGATVTERIKPGTVRMFYGGFWEPQDPRNPESLDMAGSANVLTSNQPASCHAHLHRVQHTMVEIRKWKE